MHALVTEAERRGYAVANDGLLVISVRDHQYRLRIAEEKVAVRGPWHTETRRRAVVAYPQYLAPRKMRNYDSRATGRLTITIDHGYVREGRSSSFADRKSWTLEDKLPDVLRELEIRAAEDDHNQR